MTFFRRPLVPIGRKPRPADWLGRSSIDAKWRWAWQNLVLGIPFWEGAGPPNGYDSGSRLNIPSDTTGLSWGAREYTLGNGLGSIHPRVDTGRLRYNIAALTGDIPISMFTACHQTDENNRTAHVFHSVWPFGNKLALTGNQTVTNYRRFMQNDITTNYGAAGTFSFTLGGIRNVGGSGEAIFNGRHDKTYAALALPDLDNGFGSNIQMGANETDLGGTGPLPTAFYLWSDAKSVSQLQMLHDDPWGPFRSWVRINVPSAAAPPSGSRGELHVYGRGYRRGVAVGVG